MRKRKGGIIEIVASAAIVLVSVGGAAAGQRSTGQQLPSLIAPSLYGPDVYQFYCSSCHGREGRGDGPVGAALKTPPADLTMLTHRNGGTFPSKEIEAFITYGRSDASAAHMTEMPVWGYTFRGLETDDALVKIRLENVVKYLESIQVK
jgi:mono/diheme cytochrome c family protein